MTQRLECALPGLAGFSGKNSLLSGKQKGSSRKFVVLTIDNPGPSEAPYVSTLWHEDRIVGKTLSGGWGYRVDQSIAKLPCDPRRKGGVEIFGARHTAMIHPDRPFWNSENVRLSV